MVPPRRSLAAMDFHDVVGGSMVSFVKETAGERGLKFPDSVQRDLEGHRRWSARARRATGGCRGGLSLTDPGESAGPVPAAVRE